MSQQASARASQPATDTVKAFYFVTGDTHPGLVARLVQPFAKLGLSLERVHVSTENGTGDTLEADLRVSDLTPQQAHVIEKSLGAIVGVKSVIALVEHSG